MFPVPPVISQPPSIMMDQMKTAPTLIVDFVPKPFILCIYKSISKHDLDHMKQHGRVVEFGNAFVNRPIDSYPFDYLILDFREDDHRYYFQRHVYHHSSNYHLILYRRFFETNNGLTFHNEIIDFPPHNVFKEEFDNHLLENPIPAPNCCLSLIRHCCHH